MCCSKGCAFYKSFPVLYKDFGGNGNLKDLKDILIDEDYIETMNETIFDFKIVYNNVCSRGCFPKVNIKDYATEKWTEFLKIPSARSKCIYYHTVVIIKSKNQNDQSYFWSIEKNDKQIIVQRSENLYNLISRIDEEARELTYDQVIENAFKDKNIKEIPILHMGKLLRHIALHESKISYKCLGSFFNCNGYTKRIVNYIQNIEVRTYYSLLKNLRDEKYLPKFIKKLHELCYPIKAKVETVIIEFINLAKKYNEPELKNGAESFVKKKEEEMSKNKNV